MFEGVELRPFMECTFSRWHPKVGDPTVMGWVTVGVYLVSFVLALLVVRKADPSRVSLRRFWLFLVFLMLFLGINKQLDLQSFLTASARCIAKLQGWYEQRRPFQIKVVLFMGAAALSVGLLMLWQLRRDLRRNWLALAGMTFVFGFVLIRAVGWHGFDALINTRIVNIRLNWVLELSGLVLICLNALLLLRSRRIAYPRRRRRRHGAGEEGEARFARRRRRRIEPEPERFRRDFSDRADGEIDGGG
ncbi:MAG TPA: isopropylmalate isomerase [Aliiroseovarius sp.]|nr:isopropylmalate isomerase [Aliiroseovarius sp.]